MPKTRNVKNVKNVRKNRSLKKRNNRNKNMRKKSLRKGGNKNRKTNKRRMRGGLSPENRDTFREIHLRRRKKTGPRNRLQTNHIPNPKITPSSFPAMASEQPAILSIKQFMENTPNLTDEEVNILQQMLNRHKKEWNAKKKGMINNINRYKFSNRKAFTNFLPQQGIGPSPAGLRNIIRAYKAKAEAEAKRAPPAINIKPVLELGRTL